MAALPAATPAEPGRASRVDAVPSTALVVGAVFSTQLGASLAKGLFDDLGPAGTVLLRTLLAAVVLGLVWRPSVLRRSRADLALVALFGVALGAMNLSFYLAIDRIPLGVAVTIEFAGPLAVAVAGSRRLLDLIWVALAATGILLLADPSGGGADPAGIALALSAGVFWGAYILLSARTGRVFPGGGGLALAMGVASLVVLPLGVVQGGGSLLSPGLLALGLGVAVLSSALPYSLELEALRRLPAGVFGVLLSLEPGVAALLGLVVLGEGLGPLDVLAIALVTVACAGATRGAATPGPAG